jgi:hypothetical protein
MRIFTINWSNDNLVYVYKEKLEENENHFNINLYLNNKKFNKKRNIIIYSNFEKWYLQYINNQKIFIPKEVYNLFDCYKKDELTIDIIKTILKKNNKNNYYKSISTIYLKLIHNKEFEINKELINDIRIIFFKLIEDNLNISINPRFLFINILKILDKISLSESIPTLKTCDRNLFNNISWNIIYKNYLNKLI